MSPRRTLALIRHEVRLMRRDPMPILVLIGFPIVAMIFFRSAMRLALVAEGYPAANGSEQVVPGQGATNAFFVVGMTGLAFFAEHGWHTWQRLQASSAGAFEIIAAKALPRLVLVLTQFAVVFVAGVVLLDLRIDGTAIALIPLAVAFGVCLVLLGVMLAALCRTIEQANAIAMSGIVLLGALGGAFVPMSLVPGWARAVAPATPTYWVMRGARSVILDGLGIGAVLLPVTVLAGMAVAAAAVAVLTFRSSDAKVSWT